LYWAVSAKEINKKIDLKDRAKKTNKAFHIIKGADALGCGCLLSGRFCSAWAGFFDLAAWAGCFQLQDRVSWVTGFVCQPGLAAK